MSSHKRKIEKRLQQSKLSIVLFAFVAVLIVGVCGVRMVKLHQQQLELTVTENTLKSEKEAVVQEADNLKEKAKYMQTNKYIEDEAKNKLGLVNPDEILIKPKEDE